MGIVDNHGKPYPVGTAETFGSTGLNVDQQRSLGKSERLAGQVNAPLVRANRWEDLAAKLQGKIDAGVGPDRETNLMNRIQRMNDRVARLRRY